MWKFFGAFIGYIFLKFDGAIAGFLLGSLADVYLSSKQGNVSGVHINLNSTLNNYTGDFNFILVSLTAAVMSSDGQATRSELEYVKDFFVKQFGVEKTKQNLLLLREALKKGVPLDHICAVARENMNYHSRLQVMHYLFGVAYADGRFSSTEQNLLYRIATYLQISATDFRTIGAMFGSNNNTTADSRAYEILGIERNTTEEEIKKAYRQMALKYHPDRVTHLGEDVRKAAEEKFKKIQEAYEAIKKEKGIA